MARPTEQLAVDTVRALAMDAVQQANSGHPGMPLGMADIGVVLWTQFLKVDPTEPTWPDRDRFVLSNGHGSMLLYSLLHLAGFPLSLEDLRSFRQWGSPTAGHPERHPALGIEMTTGPLGQGFATAVGMAAAEAHLRAAFGPDLVDHRTFVFAGDGDLMEGVASRRPPWPGTWAWAASSACTTTTRSPSRAPPPWPSPRTWPPASPPTAGIRSRWTGTIARRWLGPSPPRSPRRDGRR